MLLNNKCYILSACPSWQRTYHLENTAQIYFTPTIFRIMLKNDKKSKLYRISIKIFLNKNKNSLSKLNTVKCSKPKQYSKKNVKMVKEKCPKLNEFLMNLLV